MPSVYNQTKTSRDKPYLKHEVANAPVELGSVVVLLVTQPQEVLRHSRNDVAVDLDVDVPLGGLELAVPLLLDAVPPVVVR